MERERERERERYEKHDIWLLGAALPNLTQMASRYCERPSPESVLATTNTSCQLCAFVLSLLLPLLLLLVLLLVVVLVLVLILVLVFV